MLTCEGYIDMRSIRAIRRAKHDAVPISVTPLGSAGGNIPGINDSKRHDEFEIIDDENQTPSDAEDVGGEAGTGTATEKTKLRLKRSFELVLRNGHAVRFEAHSAMVALEWIGKLRALCGYWSRRHLVDAEEEMRLIETVRGVVTPKHKHDGADEISDPPRIGDFWNWCILEGCRPIIKAGRLYEKKGLHKLYKHMLVILTHGHLILFHLKGTKSAHHHRSRSINLIDSYTYSGQLAVATLPKEDTSAEPTARRYQDGLEANDTDEDVTFIIWYRPHSAQISQSTTPEGSANEYSAKIRPLSGKHKMLICKARSKFERDLWCYALNAEIERLARATAARERRLRDTQGI